MATATIDAPPVAGVEFREIPGQPGCLLGSDRSAWTSRVRGRPSPHSPPASRWRRVRIQRRSPRSGARTIVLWDRALGRSVRLDLDRLHASLFPA
jgi:hypothetical protein